MATTTIALKTRKSRPGHSEADKPKPQPVPKDITVDKQDAVAYSEIAVRNNAAIMDYCRTSMSALGGATAGIMGLTSLHGFIFYFISAILLSVMLMVKAGSRWNKYFVSRRVLFFSGLFGGLFTYILFWTFLYGMVHVY
ncbi:ER membrane protein complex subunit 6 isoform X1 [Octopus sinensis]|uniref:ER membrane protein complex subunit 6 n=1 Tax=Octopus sinensis TaxID=2607531 RepID=A0A7E6FSV8_9MOLL|nr:ER membrane protein complex subunit 6 isoform X1 [Octopus sinensis]